MRFKYQRLARGEWRSDRVVSCAGERVLQAAVETMRICLVTADVVLQGTGSKKTIENL